jgi:hypothetical protein
MPASTSVHGPRPADNIALLSLNLGTDWAHALWAHPKVEVANCAEPRREQAFTTRPSTRPTSATALL